MNDDLSEGSAENLLIVTSERKAAEKELEAAKSCDDTDIDEIEQLEAVLEICRAKEKNVIDAHWRARNEIFSYYRTHPEALDKILEIDFDD